MKRQGTGGGGESLMGNKSLIWAHLKATQISFSNIKSKMQYCLCFLYSIYVCLFKFCLVEFRLLHFYDGSPLYWSLRPSRMKHNSTPCTFDIS